ncbi:MAG: tetratricopeptide repeat protein [Dokdonella sp.]
MGFSELLRELHRRHVIRVAAAYAVVAWAVIEISATVVPLLRLPESITLVFAVLLLIGFPITVVLAWIYELTPDGIRRTEPAHSPDARPPEHAHKIGWYLNIVIISVLSLALAVLLWREFHPPATALPAIATGQRASVIDKPARKSIAVLPFKNLSADQDNAYFAIGMQDEILSRLASLRELKVISRTSTERYRSQPEQLKAIGSELGVATILEGSVQKYGDKLRVAVQLIDAGSDSNLWAQTYDRDIKDLFQVQSDVAGQIADALRIKLLPADVAAISQVPTSNQAAYDLFLRAEFLRNAAWTQFTSEGLDAAIDLYQQAEANDPEFALAYAQHSLASSYQFWRGGTKRMSMFELARAAHDRAEQALLVQPNLADAHLAKGFYDYWVHLDYPAALQSFDEALRLRPNDANALRATAYVYRRQGPLDEAIRRLEEAAVLDPRNSALADELARTYGLARRYAEANRSVQRALALDPDNTSAAGFQARLIIARSGDFDSALASLHGSHPNVQLLRAGVLALQGKYSDAIALIDAIPDTTATFNALDGGSKNLLLGVFYHDVGEFEKARPLLEQAHQQIVKEISAQPADSPGLALFWLKRGQTEALLGDRQAALQSVAKALEILPPSKDKFRGLEVLREAADVYVRAGRGDLALPLIEQLLTRPDAGVTLPVAVLRVDPVWDTLRSEPRFQALLELHVDE